MLLRVIDSGSKTISMGLLFAIISRLVEFLGRVDRVNGVTGCVPSHGDGKPRESRSSRLTRGNDPEDQNAVSLSLSLPLERELVCDRDFSRSLCRRSTQVSAFDKRSRGEQSGESRRRRHWGYSGANGRFCRKNRVVKPTERSAR